MMKRLLSSLPIWVVLADMAYGFALNISQSMNLHQNTHSAADAALAVTPDIAFNSLQLLSNGGMILIIGFGLVVLLQLNRTVINKQILPIGIFRTLGLLAVFAFSIPSLWEWGWAIHSLISGRLPFSFGNIRYFTTALCLPFIAALYLIRLFGWYRLHQSAAPSPERAQPTSRTSPSAEK